MSRKLFIAFAFTILLTAMLPSSDQSAEAIPLLTATPQPTQTPLPGSDQTTAIAVVVASAANVRAEPDAEADIVTEVGRESSFPVIAQAMTESERWFQVELPDGETGWLHEGTVRLVVTWNPVVETFDGVDMVLVPAGCFLMGSESGESDEQPVHLQCFDEPFWLDRYEVSNRRYGSEGYYSGDTRPRESVTWFEAAAYCEDRGARLPTEAEWEYAARGPESLVYPWGGQFVDENAVSSWQETARETESVGSRPGGASWVGAFNLSGNVWEWTSTIYEDYPYSAEDGREDPDDESGYRVARGGGCCSYIIADVRAAFRFPVDPYTADPNIGFRCAKDEA